MSATVPPTDDDAIHAVVARLARPDGAGGHVIERAAILAAGADSAAIEAWIIAHAGTPELIQTAASPTGLHGRRSGDLGGDRAPRRFLLPVGVL